MTSFTDTPPTRPLGLSLEDSEMAQKRSAQLAELIPVLAAGIKPNLLELAIELADDLTSALSNLR